MSEVAGKPVYGMRPPASDGTVVYTLRVGISLSHLVVAPGGVIIVDTGLPGNASRIMGRLRALGRTDVRAIFVTHAHLDHYGSANALRRMCGAPIVIHSQDADDMARGVTKVRYGRGMGKLGKGFLQVIEPFVRFPTVADQVVEEGDALAVPGLDAVVLLTPGHTPGSATLMVGGRSAFVGDLATYYHRPRPQHLYADNWTLVASSYARLRDLNPEWVYPSHGRTPFAGYLLGTAQPAGEKSAL